MVTYNTRKVVTYNTLGSFFFRIFFYGGPSCDAVWRDIDKRLFGGGSKVFELCFYAPLFSSFDLCPVNFIGHSDTEITLFSMQFFYLGLEIIWKICYYLYLTCLWCPLLFKTDVQCLSSWKSFFQFWRQIQILADFGHNFADFF